MNYMESIINNGQGNTFPSPFHYRYIGSDNYNLGLLSGIPDLYVLGAAADSATLPEIGRSYSNIFRIIAHRSPGGATVFPASGQTINGSSSFQMESRTPYTFYTLYAGTPVTDWRAVSG